MNFTEYAFGCLPLRPNSRFNMMKNFYRFRAAAIMIALLFFMTTSFDKGSPVSNGYNDDYENPDNGNGDDGDDDTPDASDYGTLIVGTWGPSYYSEEIVDTNPADGEDYSDFYEEKMDPYYNPLVFGADGTMYDVAGGTAVGTYSVVGNRLYWREGGDVQVFEIRFEGNDYMELVISGADDEMAYVVTMGFDRLSDDVAF